MEGKRDIHSSSKGRKGKRSLRGKRADIQRGGNSIRIIHDKRVSHSCCHNPERRKGIGAVLFTLGIPSAIAGFIMTIVSATDDDNDNKYPKVFIAAGPILLCLSVIFFCAGIFLHSSYVRKAFEDCFSLDNRDSFCRVRCPALSQCLSPDDTIVINKAGIKALESEPGKSVLKRNRLLSDAQLYGLNSGSADKEANDVFEDDSKFGEKSCVQVKRKPRGVHFSDGDVEYDPRKRSHSATSDNNSVLSLKHCKIHPKSDDIWWTDELGKKVVRANSHTDAFQFQTTEL